VFYAVDSNSNDLFESLIALKEHDIMDMTAFVKQALVQVVRGVKEAQAEMDTFAVNIDGEGPLTVNFDIAVTIDVDQNAASGIRINVLQGPNSCRDSVDTTAPSTAHRISFQIPLSLSDESGNNVQQQQNEKRGSG